MKLLEAQLQRCGPENLAAPPSATGGPPTWAYFLIYLLGFLSGVLAVVFCKPGRKEPAFTLPEAAPEPLAEAGPPRRSRALRLGNLREIAENAVEQ